MTPSYTLQAQATFPCLFVDAWPDKATAYLGVILMSENAALQIAEDSLPHSRGHPIRELFSA